MFKNNKPNWNEFDQFFSNFNPFVEASKIPKEDIGRYLDHLKENYSEVGMNTREEDSKYLIEIELPENVDPYTIKYELINKSKPSGKNLTTIIVTLPKISEQ
ncbi:hypothetical protein HNQ94_001579 [Salirhabdus euzebyi]|uniref:Uncharacterized protein n=1 Tax=Salirhabdus euzebyi TaxID=394506 RepID=A0A841Q3Z3_9BACI|nr:hypothetical protein [Salirhabdus euzebyi]MBB6453131.1 hypothetical protein [Salirhabdus euzebyi]